MENGNSTARDAFFGNPPDSGAAFLPAVSLYFAMEPRELRSRFEIGRLRFDLRERPAPDLNPGRAEAMRLYQKAADFAGRAPSKPERPLARFDDTA